MKRAAVPSILVSVLVLAVTGIVAAQQPKMHKIGELTARPGLRQSSGEFVQALRELGYVEGKNITFEIRSAEGRFERFPELAAELIRLKVDVLVATSTPEAVAFKNATKTIQFFKSTSSDPIEVGLVKSLARPGGNVTGVTLISTELIGKRLELLTAAIPKLSRVAVLWNSPFLRPGRTPKESSQWKPSLEPARQLGLELHSMEVRKPDELNDAFKEAIRAGSTAIAVQLSPLIAANQKRIVDLAAKYRLPTIYPREDFVDNGGLMSYGADRKEPYKRLAVLVDRILRGAKPADLPVEQPTKFQLVVNLKAAKEISLTIPQNVLVRADRVIR